MKHRWVALTLLQVCILISGCIMFPERMPYILEGNELYAKQWEMSSSTKTEVLDRSRPSAIWEDENTFIYFWRESEWGVNFLLFGWAGGAETGPIRSRWDDYIGLARFDETDKLDSIWVGAGPAHQDSLYGLVYEPVAAKLNYRKKQNPKSLLIMRVSVNSDGRQVERPLDYLNFRVADFSTIGKFKKLKNKSINKKFENKGWLVFEGEPGDSLYLAFSYVHKNYNYGEENEYVKEIEINFPYYIPPWRIEVPDAAYAYIGTFLFRNSEAGPLNITCEHYEAGLARQVIAEQFPEATDLSVSLAKKHSGPLVLRTPAAYR